MLRQCPECATVAGSDDRFCGECGTTLPVAPLCDECGEAVGEDDRFCGECGTALGAGHAAESPPEPETPEESGDEPWPHDRKSADSSRTMLLVAAAVLVTVLLIGAWWWLAGLGTAPSPAAASIEAPVVSGDAEEGLEVSPATGPGVAGSTAEAPEASAPRAAAQRDSSPGPNERELPTPIREVDPPGRAAPASPPDVAGRGVAGSTEPVPEDADTSAAAERQTARRSAVEPAPGAFSEPQRLRLRVTSDPPGARVLVDGAITAGVTPYELELDSFDPLTIGARLEGHEELDLFFDPTATGGQPGDRLMVHLPLVPLDGAAPAGKGTGESGDPGAGTSSGGANPAEAEPSPPVVVQPVKIHHVAPRYPANARRAGVEGVVVLEATVGVDGSVGNVTVVRGPGRGLREAAIEAVRQWRYRPGTVDGEATEMLIGVQVQFSIDGAA